MPQLDLLCLSHQLQLNTTPYTHSKTINHILFTYKQPVYTINPHNLHNINLLLDIENPKLLIMALQPYSKLRPLK